jgi:hypothetical protein
LNTYIALRAALGLRVTAKHSPAVIADACQAKGICVPHTGSGACDASTRLVCACDGKTTALQFGCDLPTGYELIPIVHAGPCADAAP